MHFRRQFLRHALPRNQVLGRVRRLQIAPALEGPMRPWHHPDQLRPKMQPCKAPPGLVGLLGDIDYRLAAAGAYICAALGRAPSSKVALALAGRAA